MATPPIHKGRGNVPPPNPQSRYYAAAAAIHNSPRETSMKITIDVAVDILSKHNVDHGQAAAAAIPLGRAIATFRAKRRLQLLAVRESGFSQSSEGVTRRRAAKAYTTFNTPDVFDEALSLAFVPQPVLREAVRFNVARPTDGDCIDLDAMDADDSSIIGVTHHAINATLGFRYVMSINQSLAIMRPMLVAAGVDARAIDGLSGYIVGTVRGIALSSKQMRGWRSADAYLEANDSLVMRDTGRSVVFATLVMAGVMQSFNE